jgi:hypothetical protein
MQATSIQYDTARLQQEEHLCRLSQDEAMKRLHRAWMKRKYGMDITVVPGLFRVAIGKSDLTQCITEMLVEARGKAPMPNQLWLKAFSIFGRVIKAGPITKDEHHKWLRQHKNDFSLIRWWVASTDKPKQASLCFYAWEPMAQITYYLRSKERLPPERRGPFGPEAERLKKQCQRLGLRHSKIRLIKSIDPQLTKEKLIRLFCFEPFDQFRA